MKIRRYKKVHRHMNFYVYNFGFREPYQVLIDGTFCFTALNNQVNISEVIPKYLQGELKFLTTQCVLIEMENLGSKVNGALLILKKFGIHKCGHEKKSIPGADCLYSMVKGDNQKHYIIATQDRELQSKLRVVKGIPLLYLHQKAPVLEKPSDASVFATKNIAGLTEYELKKIEELRKETDGEETSTTFVKKKKKKTQPNPMSCLKKKKKGDNRVQKSKEVTEKKEKRGKKVRIPKHVKDCLLKNKDVG